MIKEPVSAMSSAKKAPKTLDHIRLSKTQNGGYMAEHHYKSGGMNPYTEPDIYAFGKGPEVVKHLNAHLGLKENRSINSSSNNAYGGQPGGKPKPEMADAEPTVMQGNRRTSGEQRGNA